jgi:antitoxin MazE
VSRVTVGKMGKKPGHSAPERNRDGHRGIHSGERLDIETHDGEIIIRRAVPRFTLGELFRGKTPEEWRGAYASAFDWGPDVGREVVEE